MACASVYPGAGGRWRCPYLPDMAGRRLDEEGGEFCRRAEARPPPRLGSLGPSKFSGGLKEVSVCAKCPDGSQRALSKKIAQDRVADGGWYAWFWTRLALDPAGGRVTVATGVTRKTARRQVGHGRRAAHGPVQRRSAESLPQQGTQWHGKCSDTERGRGPRDGRHARTCERT